MLCYHHIKYEEIHGVDEIVLISRSEHVRLHRRLRKSGKCNVPVGELAIISNHAYIRRKYNVTDEGRIAWELNYKIRRAWVYFKYFEHRNFRKLPDMDIIG